MIGTLYLSAYFGKNFSVGDGLKNEFFSPPKTDGQTKVVNRCLEAYLLCFASEQPKNWSLWLHLAELWYNTAFHVTTGTIQVSLEVSLAEGSGRNEKICR